MNLPDPLLMFTVHSKSTDGPQNPRAAAVLTALQGLAPSAKQPADFAGPRIEVFESEEALAACLGSSIPSEATVALFDTLSGGGFNMTYRGQRRTSEASQTHAPRWATNAYWGVQIHRGVHTEHCARFIRAVFGWRFRTQLEVDELPWGPRETTKDGSLTSRRRNGRNRRRSEARSFV